MSLVSCERPTETSPASVVPIVPITEPDSGAQPPAPACPEGMTLVDGGSFTPAQRANLDEVWGASFDSYNVAPFCLATLEATRKQFHTCIVAGECVPGRDYHPPVHPSAAHCRLPDIACDGERAQWPARLLRATAAERYCAFIGARVPTASEWMWAAWGGEEARPYPWGTAAPDEHKLNVCDWGCLREACCDLEQDVVIDPLTCGMLPCLDEETLLIDADDGHPGNASPGSYPDGAGRWGHLDLLGNISELVRRDDGDWFVCGGDAYSDASFPLDTAIYESCVPLPGGAFGVRCAADPR